MSEAQLFPNGLGVVREFGSKVDPYWYPTVDEETGPVLEPGEESLWWTNLSRISVPGFVVMDSGRLFVTTRRVIVASAAFDQGSTYGSLGGVGAVIALGATVASHRRASKRRAGKVFAGHTRFEWLEGFALRPDRWSKELGPLLLLVRGHGGLINIEVSGAPRFTTEWCTWLGQVVASARLSLGTDFGDGRNRLQQLAAGSFVPDRTSVGGLGWFVPGVGEQTSRAAYRNWAQHTKT